VANARFQSNGLDVLVDAIVTQRESPEDTRERVWAAAWARGYQEIHVATPMPEVEIKGNVVYAREFPSGRSLICVDAGDVFVGFYDWFEPVPVGSRVRMTPEFGKKNTWSMKASAMVGCGLAIRFDESASPVRAVGPSWVDRLRACMQSIRDNELAVRKRIEVERSALQFKTEPPPFRSEMEEADKALRERVLQSGYTEDEKRQIAKIKTQEAMQAFVAARNKRLVDIYRAEVLKFREQIPELRAAYDQRYAEYVAFRQAIDHFNEVDARSRSITDQSMRSAQQLDAIEQAILNVRPVALEEVEENPRARFGEIVSTIDLLFELVPKRLQNVASAS
jgi:hypothetical protein